MARKEKRYRRLPGRSRKRLSAFDATRCRLWLGSDHLLHVRFSYIAESVKWFHFNDIQALVISRTRTGMIANAILGIIIIGFGLPSALGIYWLNWPRGLSIFLGILAGVGLLYFLINTLLGPTCVSRLHTAVQIEDLPSLRRLRSARKTFGILSAAIRETQGDLTPEIIDETAEADAEVKASSRAFSAVWGPQEQKHESGNLHYALFVLLLVGAACALIDIFFQHAIKNLLDTVWFLATLFLVVVAVGKQNRTDLSSLLKGITWTVLGALIISYIVGWAYAMAYRISHPEVINSNPFDLRFEGAFFQFLNGARALVYSVLAAFGLNELNKFRSKYAASQTDSSSNENAGGEE